MNYLLTKSKYIRGLQCPRAMYLDVYRPELARISFETRQRFVRGRSFEALYKATFPTGIDVSAQLRGRIDSYPELTAQLLSQPGEVVLFEAGFLYNEVLVLADVVHKTAQGRFVVHEVKNSTHVSPTFRRDVAIQHYVISHCVSHVDEFSLVYNDGSDGFLTQDLLQPSVEAMPQIAQQVEAFKVVLHGLEPQPPMGPQCDDPYECPYKSYCRGTLPTQLELGF